MASVIVRDSYGATKQLFFDGEYPETCPKCSSNFLAIDGNGFTCVECQERFNLICSDKDLQGGED